eukprot:gene1864-2445_t
MGGAVTALRDIPQDELIRQCSEVYASDPQRWEHIIFEAKKKATRDKLTASTTGGDTPSTDSSPISPKDKSDSIEVIRSSQQICSVINRLREDPPYFISYLERHLELFIDDFVYRDSNGDRGVNIRTKEGKLAVYEAIDFLRNSTPRPPLGVSEHLTSVAAEHVLF